MVSKLHHCGKVDESRQNGCKTVRLIMHLYVILCGNVYYNFKLYMDNSIKFKICARSNEQK